ncbi:hypothetical protein ACIA8O_30895 [Kitasatospora sp. NPDC051853]|uniref:hypothetical protein n=1 Tax=Kitasatospora sp. NPDC051853 TaxID=3364058 RepID=UPI0037996E84
MTKKMLLVAALTIAGTFLAGGTATASAPTTVRTGTEHRSTDFWAFVPVQFVEELLDEWTPVG